MKDYANWCENRNTLSEGEPRGDVCPAHAQHTTFVLSILALAPILSSPGEVPQVDCTGPHTFPAKHVA